MKFDLGPQCGMCGVGSVNGNLCGEQFQGPGIGDLSLGQGAGNMSMGLGTRDHFAPHYPAPTLYGFFGAFGTMMYAFNFVPVFPTIQADMAFKGRFKWVVVISCFFIFVTYASVTIVAYQFLGDCVQPVVIENLRFGISKDAANGLMATHLVSAFPMVVNAPNQYLEGLIGIPQSKKGECLTS